MTVRLSETARKIIRLAIPSIITNITVPMLALIDLAIVGRLGDALYIAAISLGGAVINLVYWNFGFLRMSASGLTSQALGAGESVRIVETLVRALVLGFIGSIPIVLFRDEIIGAVLGFIGTEDELRKYACDYFGMCVLGAPACIMVTGFKGWFIGMQDTRSAMVVALSENVLNVILSAVFVFAMDFCVSGVAMGTMLSQYFGLAVCFGLFAVKYGAFVGEIRRCKPFDGLFRFFGFSALIVVRNSCIILVSTGFTFLGSEYGEVQLSVNTMLIQFFYFFSYFVDGFAYAGEALVGKCVGAKAEAEERETVACLFKIGFVFVLIFSAVYICFSDGIVSLLTDNLEVREASSAYLHYAWLVPVAGFAAFLWDGVMVGRTQSGAMALTLVVSTIVFFVLYHFLKGVMGAEGLWVAFVVYLGVRSVVQTMLRNCYWLSR